jgi:hypothetical protein
LWHQLEKRFVFFPTSQIVETPGQAGLAYEDVSFITEDRRRLHGWFVPGTNRATWLWFHGNGGNVSHRVEELALMHHRLGVNLFIFDYRGYGNSDGRPTEWGTYRDARAALGYLQGRPGVAPGEVIYFGHSLGAAVAVELAAAYPPLGLILVSPFASVSDMARLTFPLLPVTWLVRNTYDSSARIPNVRCPLLVIHGDRDDTVPLSQAKKLFDRANPPKHFRLLPGAGHNDTFTTGGSAYWDALAEFQAELSPRGADTELS